MTTISDLPRDSLEEVLSRVPVTSLRKVRFTCKNWNILSKHESFTKKQIAQAKAAAKKQGEEFQVIMTMNRKVYLMSVNLNGIDKGSFIKPKGKLISLKDANRVRISRFFHSDGLVLCITGDISPRLMVWNPCSGQTRWIQPRISYHFLEIYAFGYERKNNSLRSHKILRFSDYNEFEIYSLDSNSWEVVDITLNGVILFYQPGVSLKGNTYWLAREEGQLIPALLCFDFTRERFGPRLPLPFQYHCEDTVTISSVREEQLAVLVQSSVIGWAEIWISDKIGPNSVSWSKLFLKFQMRKMPFSSASFFVDQKKKVAVVLDKDKSFLRNIAYIIGEDGYFKQVDLGASFRYYFPLVCSYVPSSVQIQQT